MEQVFFETDEHGSIEFPYAVYRILIPDYINSFPLHWHNEVEIIYVSRGLGEITADGRHYTVKDGDIVIIMPQVIHSINQAGASIMEYYNILFDFSLLASPADVCYDKYIKPLFTREKSPPVHITATDPLHDTLYAHIEKLIQVRKKSDCELSVKARLFDIVDCLYRNARSADGESFESHLHYSKLKAVLALVRTRYGEKLTVADAAQACMYSQSYFMKLFRELTDKSFTEFLIDYRLNVAASMLKKTDISVSDVSERCGFDNFSYFSRAFKAKHNISPREYRKAAVQKQ